MDEFDDDEGFENEMDAESFIMEKSPKIKKITVMLQAVKCLTISFFYPKQQWKDDLSAMAAVVVGTGQIQAPKRNQPS